MVRHRILLENVTQAEIFRMHGIYLVQISKFAEKFTKGKSALAQRRNSHSRGEEIENLKKIISDQLLVIDAFNLSLSFCTATIQLKVSSIASSDLLSTPLGSELFEYWNSLMLDSASTISS